MNVRYLCNRFNIYSLVKRREAFFNCQFFETHIRRKLYFHLTLYSNWTCIYQKIYYVTILELQFIRNEGRFNQQREDKSRVHNLQCK